MHVSSIFKKINFINSYVAVLIAVVNFLNISVFYKLILLICAFSLLATTTLYLIAKIKNTYTENDNI